MSARDRKIEALEARLRDASQAITYHQAVLAALTRRAGGEIRLSKREVDAALGTKLTTAADGRGGFVLKVPALLFSPDGRVLR